MSGEVGAVRILIVEDQVLFSEAIRLALEERDMVVVGMATTGEEALAMAQETDPDLALVDIGLPDRSGLAVGKQILEEHPGVKVLALTVLEDPRVMREALRLGFHGYILKDIPVVRFVRAVETVMAGEVVVPRKRAPRLTGTGSSDDEAVALLASQLTRRELEVLELLVEGAEGLAIAQRLGIAPNTVRTHVQSILTKLQVHSRLEAVAFAVQHRLTPLPRTSDRGVAKP